MSDTVKKRPAMPNAPARKPNAPPAKASATASREATASRRGGSVVPREVSYGSPKLKLHTLLTACAPPGVMDRIAVVRDGIPASAVATLAEALSLSKEQVAAAIAIPIATLNRKLRDGTALSTTESERVAGLLPLVAMVERWADTVGEDAPAAFSATVWLGGWLTTPNPALGGERPLRLLDTAEGRMLVGQVLGSLESGAYW